ncbi:DUF6545 domain-containing protein [Streptomyces sp. NPDC008141]|uniref:DUF6545 domain-containing protein n=1 Tax=Streptomyces sp. NPDC008141 TaxID=3364815 RepID=UPI0036E82DBA
MQFSTSWCRHRRLAPLSGALRNVVPGPRVQLSWWSNPELRHLQRKSDIRDDLRALAPYLHHAGPDEAATQRTQDRSAPPSSLATAVLHAIDTFHAGAQSPMDKGASPSVVREDPESLELLSRAVGHELRARRTRSNVR